MGRWDAWARVERTLSLRSKPSKERFPLNQWRNFGRAWSNIGKSIIYLKLIDPSLDALVCILTL
jgi:hypothetical protein